MRDLTKLNMKQLDVCVSKCEHVVNKHLYNAAIQTFSIYLSSLLFINI